MLDGTTRTSYNEEVARNSKKATNASSSTDPVSTNLPSTQVAIRLSPDLVRRLDEHQKRILTKMPFMDVTRTDAIRDLLMKALDAEER